MIIHTISTAQTADKVVVLSHENIVEEGIHQHLLAQKGAYHKLIISQTLNTKHVDGADGIDANRPMEEEANLEKAMTDNLQIPKKAVDQGELKEEEMTRTTETLHVSSPRPAISISLSLRSKDTFGQSS